MNPFDEYRRIYVTVCFIVAVIYAFALSGNLHPSFDIQDGLIFCISDGIIYGGILYLTGVILWNIFRFAIPANYISKYRFFLVCAIAILTGLFITAAESLFIFLCFPSMFGLFAYSIPVRLFVALLFFIIIRLLYIFFYEKNKNSGELTLDRNGITDIEIPGNDNTIKSLQEKNIPEVLKAVKYPVDRITVRSGQNIKIIPIDDIVFIKADGDYISINTTKGYWLKEQTMKYTEDSLPVDRFLRIHRSYIVNINYISRIERYGEKQLIVLHNNEKIKISSARYQILKQVLDL